MHLSFKDLFLPFLLVFKIFLPIFILAMLFEAIKNVPYWVFEHRARAAGFDKVDSMTGEQFEFWLAHKFKLAGYKVRRTSYQGDHGADLILTDNNGTTTAVQAKKLSKHKNRVGAQALGEVLRGKEYYSCDNAVVVTNQYYTQQAKDEALKMGILLIDRKRLVTFVEKNYGNV